MRSPATSAAAPATARSSMRRCRPAPRRRRPLRGAPPKRRAAVGGLADGRDLIVGDADRASSPRPRARTSLARALRCAIRTRPLVAGCTDVGLWVTKALAELRQGDLARPRARARPDRGRAGRARASARPRPSPTPMRRSPAIDPDLGEIMRRFGARRSAPPARSAATSPTARRSATSRRPHRARCELELRQGERVRTLPLEDFFLAYRKQDRQPGEFVRRVHRPQAARRTRHFRCFKVSKRFDEDISAVLGAFKLRRSRGARSRRRASPTAAWPASRARARAAEAALVGASLDEPAHLGAGPRRARGGLRAAVAIIAPRPPTGRSRRATCCVKALIEIAPASARHPHRGLRELPRRRSRPMDERPDRPEAQRPSGLGRSAGARRFVLALTQPASLRGKGSSGPSYATFTAAAARLGLEARAGRGEYLDDIREPDGTLHVAVGQSPRARGRLIALDLERCRAAPGVVAVLTAADIPGQQRRLAGLRRRPDVCRGRRHRSTARRCSRSWRQDPRRRPPRRPARARIEIDAEPPSVTRRGRDRARRDGAARLRLRPRRRRGRARRRAAPARRVAAIGGQEHFYLEGQVALAVPGEDGAMHVLSSTQHPTEVQHVVARVLGRARRHGDVRDAPHGRRLRRQGEPGDAMGGDRGARRPRDRPPLQAPARPRRRFRPHRQAPRLPLRLARSASTTTGGSPGYDVEHLARCGFPQDLSQGVVDRTMFHADNAYLLPAVRIGSRRLQDQHGLQHGVPRLRRPAGHAGDRAGDGPRSPTPPAAIRSTCARPTSMRPGAT